MGQETKRMLQVGEMVKRNMSLVLQQEGSYVYGAQVLVTVTNVKMSPDLGLAKIYLSVYNTENKQAVILQMDEAHHKIKSAFVQRVKRQLRRIPALHFYLDDTLDEMYRLNNLFNKLESENQMGSSSEEE